MKRNWWKIAIAIMVIVAVELVYSGSVVKTKI